METQRDTVPSDGHDLDVRLFGDGGRVVYLIHPATGVPQGYYRPFAEWLASRPGAVAVTYDYALPDQTDRAALRASDRSMITMGVGDQNAMLTHVCQRWPEARIEVVGHSLGGFMTLFHDQAARIARLTTIASGPAHWLRGARPGMLKIALFWWVIGPALTRIAGYLPGRALGVGMNMPAGVFYTWRRWCTSRPFHRVDWGGALPQPDLTRFTGELRMIAFSDDDIIPPHVAQDLAALYPGAGSVAFEVVDVKARAKGPVGHLGLFRERNADLWALATP